MSEAARELVRSFVNTVDVEDGTDALADAAGYRRWAAKRGFPGPRSAAEQGLALRLRAALRGVLLSNHQGTPDPGALADLDALTSRLPLRVRAGADGVMTVVPLEDSPPATVVAAMFELAADGELERLKICPAESCQWAFYDQSRNRSKRWCSMEVCGNRQKTREYRRRTADGRSASARAG